MLQTIFMLAILLILFLLGGWMAFFGHRAFRLCGTLFGFALGVGGMLFAAGKLNLALGSLVILIGTPLLGLALGLLGAFIPLVGAGLGGVCLGYIYGVGAVYSADVLLEGAIPGLIYTSVSVALILLAFILCLVWHEAAKWLTAAFCGSYTAAFGVTLAVMWFLAGGFQSVDPTLSGSFISKLIALNDMISPNAKMIMLLFSLLFGILGGVIQARMAHRNELDEPLLSDLGTESDLMLPDEDDFSDMEESDGRKRRRGFGRKNRDEEDGLEALSFEEDGPKKPRRGSKRFDEQVEDEPVITAPLKKVSASQVAAVQQVSAPKETARESLDKTQVFRRITSATLSGAKQEPASPPKTPNVQPKAPAAAPKPFSESGLRNNAPTTLSEPRMTQAPSYTPRSQRRKGK